MAPNVILEKAIYHLTSNNSSQKSKNKTLLDSQLKTAYQSYHAAFNSAKTTSNVIARYGYSEGQYARQYQ